MALGTALNSADVRLMLNGALSALGANIDVINALNVFPVPDGDTGTNMYHTFSAAVQEAEKVTEESVGRILDAAAFGSLMGARGNSGVILSQFMRGFANRLKAEKELTSSDLIMALTDAINTAYSAVMKPVEGTMLTVARDAAKAGVQALKDGRELMEVFDIILFEARNALERTPMQLAVLKKAGVVDAGGKGIVVLIEGAIDALKNGLSEEQIAVLSPQLGSLDAMGVFDRVETEEITHKYCTEFLLKGTGLVVDKIREDLEPLGDSLLVVGNSELVKIHIHTNNPGLVLEYCVPFGDLTEIKIDNMQEQNEAYRDAVSDDANDDVYDGIGIVAVAAGSGIAEIFRGLGVDEIVQGGQTMNPSIEDLSKAVERIKADKVIILPNNSNVILTAEQVKNITKKNVGVVPSKSVVEGIAALLGFDREQDLESNMESLTDALNFVKAGEVTYAVRDWEADDMVVNEKDYIGLYNRELKAVGTDLNEVVCKLLDHIVEETDEVITLYYGEDVAEEDTESLCEQLEERYSWCDIEVYYGGQPLYYYLISVE